MRRALAVGVAAAALLAACSPDDPPQEDAEPGAVGRGSAEGRIVDVQGGRLIYPPEVDTSSVGVFEPLDVDGFEAAYSEAAERPVPLAVALRACRNHGGGRFTYDIQWRPPADLPLPIDAAFYVGVGGRAAAYSYVSGLGTFVGELREPGAIRLVQQIDRELFGELSAEDASTIGVHPDERTLRSCELNVVSEWYVDDQTADDVAFTWADDLVEIETDVGSFQWLAGSDHANASSVEQLLLDAPPDFPHWPDVIWFAPDAPLESLVVRERFGCWTVRSSWHEGRVEVSQRRGCDDPAYRPTLDQRQVAIDDPAWDVVVTGSVDEVSALVEQLRRLPVAGVPPLGEPPAFDALVEFELQAEEQGWVIHDRVPWGTDGTLVVWSGDEQLDERLDAVQVSGFRAGADVNGGGGGGIAIQRGVCVRGFAGGGGSEDPLGFAFVFFVDPMISSVEVERGPDVWEAVEIVDVGDFEYALLADDLVPDEYWNYNGPRVRGFDGAGDPLDCVTAGE